MSMLGNNKRLGYDRQSIELYTGRPAQFVDPFIFDTVIGAICKWVDTPNYKGYESLDCGRIALLNSTAEAGSDMLLAMGQEVNKEANIALYNKLVRLEKKVTPAAWTKGPLVICDLTATTFRMPDLRDVFPRFYGASRAAGTYQSDAMRNVVGEIGLAYGAIGGVFYEKVRQGSGVPFSGSTNSYGFVGFDASRGLPAGTTTDPITGEFRPVNTAFVPAIYR